MPFLRRDRVSNICIFIRPTFVGNDTRTERFAVNTARASIEALGGTGSSKRDLGLHPTNIQLYVTHSLA